MFVSAHIQLCFNITDMLQTAAVLTLDGVGPRARIMARPLSTKVSIHCY